MSGEDELKQRPMFIYGIRAFPDGGWELVDPEFWEEKPVDPPERRPHLPPPGTPPRHPPSATEAPE
jgi:hypothetical protein